jgi:hypothetical protein
MSDPGDESRQLLASFQTVDGHGFLERNDVASIVAPAPAASQRARAESCVETILSV